VTRLLLVALTACVTTACGGPQSPQYHQKLVVIGIDGLDPNLVRQFMHQGKLPRRQMLARRGSVQQLETTGVAVLRRADM
jgi:hypothetical protein